MKHFIRAFLWSLHGFRSAYQGEEAFRQEVWAFLVLIPLGLWLGNDAAERGLMAGSLFLVLIVELINTGIESVVDRVSTEYHELSKRAKDVGSAAVFLSLVLAVMCWGLILLPRYLG